MKPVQCEAAEDVGSRSKDIVSVEFHSVKLLCGPQNTKNTPKYNAEQNRQW